MNLVLMGPLKHDGTVYLDGAFAPLSPEQAEPLILLGVVGVSTSKEDKPSKKPVVLLNLNTASNAELLALPHIGKGLAARIEKARPIESLDSIPDLLGVAPGQWEELALLVTV